MGARGPGQRVAKCLIGRKQGRMGQAGTGTGEGGSTGETGGGSASDRVSSRLWASGLGWDGVTKDVCSISTGDSNRGDCAR